MLLSDFIVWYLFLGGLGGGTYLIASLIGAAARLRPQGDVATLRSLQPPMYAASLLSLLAGTLCLLKDATNPENVLALFVQPTFSALSVGTFALSALIFCLAFLTVFSFADFKRPHQTVLTVVQAITVVLALAVIVYTGVFLSGMIAVPLWASPLLPALFLLSSLSTGIAALFVLAVLMPNRQTISSLKTMSFFLKTDVVLIALEIATLLIMLMQVSSNPIAQASIDALVFGDYSLHFWLGFMMFGLIIPLGAELASNLQPTLPPATLGFTGGCVLLGGFFLRFCIINAGIHLSAFMFAGL